MKPIPELRWIPGTEKEPVAGYRHVVRLKSILILQQKWQEVRLSIGRSIDMTEPLSEEWRDVPIVREGEDST